MNMILVLYNQCNTVLLYKICVRAKFPLEKSWYYLKKEKKHLKFLCV